RAARTHSGGFHSFYRLPEGERLKSRAHTFVRGIDLKTGAGAYVVLPGSEINGREYTWHKDRPIVAMRKGLIERAKAFGQPSEKSAAAGKRLAEETDEAVERAKQWVDEHAPEAVQGERDNTAFQVAAKVYDFGVSKATAHELLLLWNDTKCEPPLELDDIERIVDSAGRNRQNPIGFVGTSSGFEAMAIEPDKRTKPDKARNFDWITAAQSASRALTQRRDWLIQDILHEDGECVLIGKPNEGKSFMVLAMLYHIAKGEKFAGRRVK